MMAVFEFRFPNTSSRDLSVLNGEVCEYSRSSSLSGKTFVNLNLVTLSHVKFSIGFNTSSDTLYVARIMFVLH